MGAETIDYDYRSELKVKYYNRSIYHYNFKVMSKSFIKRSVGLFGSAVCEG